MDFTLSEEQEILKKFARDFLTEKFTKKTINELEKGLGHSSEIWQEMASLGWQGLAAFLPVAGVLFHPLLRPVPDHDEIRAVLVLVDS